MTLRPFYAAQAEPLSDQSLATSTNQRLLWSATRYGCSWPVSRSPSGVNPETGFTERSSYLQRSEDSRQVLSHSRAAFRDCQRRAVVLEWTQHSKTRRKKDVGGLAHQPRLRDSLLHHVNRTQKRVHDGRRRHTGAFRWTKNVEQPTPLRSRVRWFLTVARKASVHGEAQIHRHNDF